MKNTLPLDAKYKNGTVAYASVAEACSLIPAEERGLGLTVMVGSEEYWWKVGTTDADLIVKSSGGGGGGGGGDVMSRSIAQLRTESSSSTTVRYFLTDTGREGFYYYDPTDTTSTDNGTTIIVSGSKRFKRIIDEYITPFMWGAKGDGVTDDTAAIQAMFDWLAASSKITNVLFKPGTYIISSPILLPKTLTGGNSLTFVNILGYGARLKTTAAISIFKRMPANESEKAPILDGYKGILEGFLFEGNGNVNQKGIEIGCTYGWSFRNMYFYQLGTGLYSSFSLMGEYTNLFFQLCTTYGFFGDWGRWTGATVAGTAFNGNYLHNIRCYCSSNQLTGIKFSGDGNILDRIIIEGNKPQVGIDFDSDLSGNVNINHVQNVWFEANGGTVVTSTNFKLKNAGSSDFIISGVQNPYIDTFIDWTGSGGGHDLHLEKIAYLENQGVIFKGGTISGMKLYIGKGSYADVHDLTNASFYEGGAKPPIVEEYMSSAAVGTQWSSTSDIHINPGKNGGNQRAFINGQILNNTDNIYEWGGIGGAFNLRPNRLYLGTGGVVVDDGGIIGFGRPSDKYNTSLMDLYLSRGQSGVLKVNSTGAVQMPAGTTAQRPVSSSSAHNARLRYNTDLLTWEYYDAVANAWGALATVNPYTGDTNFRYAEILPNGTIRNRKLAGTTAERPSGLTTDDKGFKFFDTSLTPARYVFWNGTQWIVPHVVSFTGDFNDLTNKPSFSTESNTYAFTFTSDGNQTIPFEAILEYVLVRPASSLAALKIGTLADDDAFLANTAIPNDANFLVLEINEYVPNSTAIYFAGITSSTEIKMIFKRLYTTTLL